MILNIHDRFSEPDPDPDDVGECFADDLGDLIMKYSGRISLGEIVGALEIHKLQIVIQNSKDEPE